MKITTQTPFKALNKAYLKETVNRNSIEIFKQELLQMINKSAFTLSEDTLKDFITEFLRNTWYNPNHIITINKERKDLSIHTGKLIKDPVAVIAEVKKMDSPEMISADNPNVKALHELVLYYLQERITGGNNEIKYLLATDVNNWVLIDANEFDKKIFGNTKIKRLYNTYVNDKKGNEFFYIEVKRLLDETEDTIIATHFTLSNFKKYVTNADKADDEKLIPIYKLLSPAHLLKLPFANDSNSLDKNFYTELLHIIGLEEIKDGSKKLIQRKKESSEASLLENAIIKLKDKECLREVPDVTRFGLTNDEQYYNIALELCITWANRILFLKLLEAQLYSYHQKDESYLFLNDAFIHDFDELNNLFLQVLAEKPGNRRDRLKNKFIKVPYLNSSLFERTELERKTIDISALDNNLPLPIHKDTVLKDGKKRKQGSLSCLSYLFTFLNSYNFASEGKAGIQEENKSLINASVLGLIFEKINGYKDGSFFTPGFITMYMCRETLRRAVVQKFNKTNNWNHNSFEQLQEAIDYTDKEKRQEANNLINSLTICDPAVGSGHFLVSALNELIAIKHDLKILQYRHNGQRINHKEYKVEIENDELIIQDIETEDFFKYALNQKGNIKPELQYLQETLFHEKETLIENCLFGVDINANSVKICRLRLWIELLKNAYYTKETNYEQLETLPNIDINIKQGNSLISRFALDEDLSTTLKKSKWTIDSYKAAVQTYRNAQSKEEKREMEELIDTIKKDFRTDIATYDPINKKLYKLRFDLLNLKRPELFSPDTKTKAKANKELQELSGSIEKLEKQKEEIQSSAIYKEAFEWRFEFPEVLNGEGKFLGFDVVIGNPPYISLQDLKKINNNTAEFYKNNFETTNFGNFDIYIPFIELINRISNKNNSSSYILPSKFLTTDYGKGIRDYLLRNKLISQIVDFGHYQVFDTATTYTCIIFLSKIGQNELRFFKTEPKNILEEGKEWGKLLYEDIASESWILDNNKANSLFNQISNHTTRLIDVPTEISRGSSTGDDKIFILKKHGEFYHNGYGDKIEIESTFLITPIFATDYSRYLFKEKKDTFLIFPYDYMNSTYTLIEEARIKNESPQLYQYLISNIDKLKKRKQFSRWYGFSAARNLKIHGNSDLLIPLLADRGLFTTTPRKKTYTLMAGGGFSISIKNDKIDKNYLLALLNSKLIFYILARESNKFRGGYITCTKQYFENLPIKILDTHSQLPFITLVDKILTAKKENPKADTSAWEKEIDELVYALYGLTEEEIKIVEGVY